MLVFSGALWIIPTFFYFVVMPLSGCDATFASSPELFLPWMAERGGVRVALWLVSGSIFLVNMIFVPLILRERFLKELPLAANIATMVGILGFFSILSSALVLAAGEMPIAEAYMKASPEVRESILVLYIWQKKTTAFIFDLLGYFLFGLWLLVSSVAALYNRTMKRAAAFFGILCSITSFCFAIGYLAELGWLGESGIGVSSFVFIPIWIVWCGLSLLKREGSSL